MSVAVLDQDERAILVALKNNDYSYSLAAKSLGIDESEVQDFFDIFKQVVKAGRLNAKWLSERDVARELDCGLLCARSLLRQYEHLMIEKSRPNGQKVKFFPPAVVGLLKPYFNLFEDGVRWFTVTQIKEMLNKDFDWVRAQLVVFTENALPKIAVDGKLRLHYPEIVVESLRKIKDAPIPVGNFLHVAKISRLTGKDPSKIRAIITELSIEAHARYVPRYGVTECYSPESFERIKQVLASVKPQEDWITVNFIAQKLNQSFHRVMSLIKYAGIEGEERFSVTANRIHIHYPPETLEIIRGLIESIPMQQGWFTCESLQRYTGKSHTWVRKRLQEGRYPHEIRIASNNVPRVHYPPWVAFTLNRMVKT